MKQHISKEQLGALVDGNNEPTIQYYRLQEKLNFKKHHLISCNDLTIGKMIEILNENFSCVDIYVHDNYVILNNDTMNGFDGNTLCDALWNAIKEII